MAAIDPTEEVITSGDAPARATLKIVRNIFDVVDEYASDNDEEDEDYDDDDIEAIRRRLGITESDDDEDDEDDEGDSDEEMVNGAGPSDPEKTRKIILQAMAKQIEEDEDDEEMADIPNGINGVAKLNKGKARAIGDDDESSEDGMTEYVVCTLDTTQVSRQPVQLPVYCLYSF
jgi:FK506-binding nuclear protein